MTEQPHDFIDRSALTDRTPLTDAPEATHPVAPDGPVPSLEEIEAEQSE